MKKIFIKIGILVLILIILVLPFSASAERSEMWSYDNYLYAGQVYDVDHSTIGNFLTITDKNNVSNTYSFETNTNIDTNVNISRFGQYFDFNGAQILSAGTTVDIYFISSFLGCYMGTLGRENLQLSVTGLEWDGTTTLSNNLVQYYSFSPPSVPAYVELKDYNFDLSVAGGFYYGIVHAQIYCPVDIYALNFEFISTFDFTIDHIDIGGGFSPTLNYLLGDINIKVVSVDTGAYKEYYDQAVEEQLSNQYANEIDQITESSEDVSNDLLIILDQEATFNEYLSLLDISRITTYLKSDTFSRLSTMQRYMYSNLPSPLRTVLIFGIVFALTAIFIGSIRLKV